MESADLQAWALIGAGIILGLLAIYLSKALPKQSAVLMAPGKLGEALETLRSPIRLPDGRIAKFNVNVVFEKPRRAA
jgi:hypothetical protein